MSDDTPIPERTSRPEAEPTVNRLIPTDPPVPPTLIRSGPSAVEPTRIRSTSAGSSRRGKAAPPLLPGEEIDGRWRILDTISSGTGEAVIYRVADASGVIAALKHYYAQHETREDVLERLLLLRHDDVLTLLDFGEVHRHRYEVYAYAAGGTAAQRIPFGDDEILEVVVPQALSGLKVLHAEGIIHRDIKPENFFYMDVDAADLVIGDFGAARYKTAETASSHMFASSVFGTTGYMPPEYYAEIIGPFTDYFALGMSLLRLRGTDVLSWYSSWHEWNRALMTDSVRVREMVPERIGELIDGLLVVNYKDRWGAEQVGRWLAGETNIPIARGGEGGYAPVKWRGKILRNRADAADYLFRVEPDAWTFYSQGYLREWLVASNKDLEAAERIDKVKDKGSAASTLRAVAFALDSERPFETPDGHRKDAIAAVADDVDAHFSAYLSDAERQREQVTYFIAARASTDERHLFWRKLVGGLSDHGFFSRFLYLADPSRTFRTLIGGRLSSVARGEEVRSIAREVDAHRNDYAKAYSTFREELLAFLDARDYSESFALVLEIEKSHDDAARRVVEIIHRFDPSLGLRSPSGDRLPDAVTAALDMLANPLRWMGDPMACAELQAFATAQHGSSTWYGIAELLRRETGLSVELLRAIAIQLLRSTFPLARVRITVPASRKRSSGMDGGNDAAPTTWRMETWFSVEDLAAERGLPLADPFRGRHEIQSIDLSVPTDAESRPDHELRRRLPHPVEEFDASLGATESVLRQDHATQLSLAARELRIRSVRRALWGAAPVVAAASGGWLPGLVFAYYNASQNEPKGAAAHMLSALYFSLSATAFPIAVTLFRSLARIGDGSIAILGKYAWWTFASAAVNLVAPVTYVIVGLAMTILNIPVGIVAGILSLLGGGRFGETYEATGSFLLHAGLAITFVLQFVIPWIEFGPDSDSAHLLDDGTPRTLQNQPLAAFEKDGGISLGTASALLFMVLVGGSADTVGLMARHGPTAATATAVNELPVATITGDSVRVRVEPSSQGKVVNALSKDESVRVLERRPPWVHIRFYRNGLPLEGWAHEQYVSQR